MINHKTLIAYLLSQGWDEIQNLDNVVALWGKGEDKVLVPLNPESPTYRNGIGETLKVLGFSQSILGLLSNPPDWMFVQIRPSECSQCPFATDSTEMNPADPPEGFYHCTLIDKRLWGEMPQCTTKDWLELLHK